MKIKKIAAFISVIAIVGLLLAGCSSNKASNKTSVKIGWTNDTEQAILGNMITILLKDRGIPVQTSPGLGGTGIAHEAINSGKLDIYPDYTGDALANVLKLDPITEPAKAYQVVKDGYLEKYNITWLEPTPFNNTYALAIKKKIADELNISTISDLKAKAPEWVIGSSVEFANRELDGYPGMTKHYGIEFKSIKPMDAGLMYTAADKGDVDVIVAFATDARIGKFELKVLEDDMNFFPSYNAASTVRNEILKEYPEIADALMKVFKNLDTDTMISLNGQVDIDNKDPAAVAQDYLKNNGYIH